MVMGQAQPTCIFLKKVVYVLCLAGFTLQSQVVATERPTKPKIFTLFYRKILSASSFNSVRLEKLLGSATAASYLLQDGYPKLITTSH